MKRTVVLLILDGWGLGPADESNPIHVVGPENFEYLNNNYPLTSLQASGISVGLPWGELGNSEVGHLTMGAGKIVYQHYPRITMKIQDGSFFENPALLAAFQHAKDNQSKVHLVGLLTRSNTHASQDHIQALLKMAENLGVSETYLHLFADGVDSHPKSLPELLERLPLEKIATLMGRYYAMDRNQNWQITRKAYETLIGRAGNSTPDLKAALADFYKRNASEEYLPPLRLQPDKFIAPNDAVIFFNYREDDISQLAEFFGNPNFEKPTELQLQNLYFTTFTQYNERLKNPVAFPADKIVNPLGKVLSDLGKTQLRLAETYRYAHVTYYFNGYVEEPFPGEYRALIPSLPLPHPEQRPELMAASITDRLIEGLHGQAFDFVMVNYCNPDTIAHTGSYDACLETVRIMDKELGKILAAVQNTPTLLFITADHGNIEQVINATTGEAETQHNHNPVPLYMVADELKGRKFPNWRNLRSETLGLLSDIAPTILDSMDIPKPPEMNGNSLLPLLI